MGDEIKYNAIKEVVGNVHTIVKLIKSKDEVVYN